MIAEALFTVTSFAALAVQQKTQGTPPAPAPETIAWLTDLEAAKQESARTNKPLFVVFRCER